MKDLKELSRMLANRAESVCMKLLPSGKRQAGIWYCGDINGGDGKSLQVQLEGERQGRWKDWADPEFHGDLIDLWRSVKGITPKQAIAEVREYLGVQLPVMSVGVKTYSKPKTGHNEPTPEGALYQWFANERKIDPSVVNRFQIKACSRNKQRFLVFPSFSPAEEWVNSSYRGLELDENGKKVVFQDAGCAPCLFGWQAISERCYSKRKIILTEGQIDAMTWHQWGFDALSIPNGNGTTWIDYEWENLEVFETIYLSFDMDGKTSEALQKVISRLGKHRCLLVKLPYKDANDCLKAGCTSEEAKEWIESAKPPPVQDFITAEDLRSRVMNEFFPPEDAKKAITPSLMSASHPDKCFKIRPGEVSVWTGISSHGKTSFLTQLFVDLMLAGENSMIASLEMKPEKIVKKMALCYAQRENLTPEMVGKFVDAIGGFLCFCDRIGFITEKDLLEMMEFAHARYGVNQFLIDSLMRIKGLDEDYPAQGEFLNTLTAFAKTRNVHVHLVAHPRKTAGDEKPTGNDLKGSSMLRNSADNVIIVARNLAKERKVADDEMTDEEAAAEWDTQVTVEKDREEGQVKSYRYRYQWKISRYEQIQRVPQEPVHNVGMSSNGKRPKKMRFN